MSEISVHSSFSVDSGPMVRQNIMATGARGEICSPHGKQEREREREREREKWTRS
jgi:hypothetical protein